MTITNKMLVILLIFFSNPRDSLCQTYITPVVGYEWNTTEAVRNDHNYGFGFRVLKTNPKYPLKSYVFGFRANRTITTNMRLNTGILYSTHQFKATMSSGECSFIDIKLNRLRALIGIEHKILDNIFFSGDLTINHLFGIRSISCSSETYRKSRMHLGVQFGLAWHFHHIVLRPHYEYGFWNLKNRSEFTATRPISGFGISLGYQFEL